MNTLLYDVCVSTDPTWPLYKYNHFNVDAANVQRIGTDLNVRTNKISENQFDFIGGVTETSNNP
jgi:hypothetical protein